MPETNFVIEPEDGYFDVQIGPTKIAYQRLGLLIGISLIMTDIGSSRQGYARKAMTAFLGLCDKEGLDVFLTPVATERRVKKSELRGFYTELGFL